MQCSDRELSGGGLCAKRVTDANPKQNNFKVKLLLNKGCRLTALSNDVPAFTTASTQLQETVSVRSVPEVRRGSVLQPAETRH